jgi:hypothetical protein
VSGTEVPRTVPVSDTRRVRSRPCRVPPQGPPPIRSFGTVGGLDGVVHRVASMAFTSRSCRYPARRSVRRSRSPR